MNMSRQEKRAELRKVAKVATKVCNGTANINEVKNLRAGIQRLQKVGVLPTPKRSIFRKMKDFFGSLTGGPVGYRVRSR